VRERERERENPERNTEGRRQRETERDRERQRERKARKENARHCVSERLKIRSKRRGDLKTHADFATYITNGGIIFSQFSRCTPQTNRFLNEGEI